MPDPSKTALTRPKTRGLLASLLKSDSDFDAFCSDYFPHVYQRFTSGMDRVQKHTLLLDHVALNDLLQALEEARPGEVARHELFLKIAHAKVSDELEDEEPESTGPSSRPIPGTPIADIFHTSGQPEHNFVEPAQATELKARLRSMGEGLLVEGPSGVGKTTAVDRVLTDLGQRQRTVWLSALSERDLLALDELIQTDFQQGGYLVVDDFHHLNQARQGKLTSLIKVLSDRNRRDAKVTLIGVNPLRASLLEYFPDVFNRFAVVTMARQPEEKVDELIRKGETVANLTFKKRREFVIAAAGSFAIAQRLCLEATLQAGILEACAEPTHLDVGPEGVIRKVHQDLAAKFRALLAAFAAFDRSPPPRGACLLLLWHLSRSENASVSLHDVRYRYAQLTEAFSWLMASNMSRFFDENAGVKRILHYDRNAAVLSAEDPQLEFYLRHLDWSEFASMTGHLLERWDRQEGPVFKSRALQLDVSVSGSSIKSATSEIIAADMAAEPGSLIRAQAGATAFILHLSDIHFGTLADATRWYDQLASDLQYELSTIKLDAVIVSGDIANRAEREEYQAAQRFFKELTREFSLSPQRIILTPGNHDVSWALSEKAYTPVRRKGYKGPLTPGMYIDASDYIELRSEAEYRERFRPFAELYEAVRLEPYPLDYEEQATVHHLPEQQIVVLGLNSAWAIDHHYKARAGIHEEALSRALQQIRNTPAYAPCLKLAVWHHPLNSNGEDRIKDAGFLERLSQAGFRLGLHGHVHRADNSLYRYDRQAGGRSIELICAGTFGAPIAEWVPGYPLQYQLLQFSGSKLVVHTRRREEVNGAWKPDARWLQGPGRDPLPRYTIDL